ncbi:MAG: acyltransferase [Candidatus Dormibacteraeota bacterium]|nr:acyltransferase [Candidatus Dormibacteraeota bacterium]
MQIGASAVQTGAVQVGRPTRAHLYQLDVIRLLTCIGVVAIHTVELILPESRAGGAVVMALHTTRELFFFLTALALTYSAGAADRVVAAVPLWRRRYPLILVPYLSWTVLYWAGDSVSWGQLWPPDVNLAQLGTDLLIGWNHLYFLFVTMQFYAVFPLLAWGLRRSRGWHWAVLGLSAALELAATGLMQYGGSEIPRALRFWFDNADINVVSYQFAFVVGAVTGAHLDAIVGVLRRNRQWVGLAAAAGVVIGEATYLVNLLVLGLPTQAAAAPLQPAIVPLTLAAVLALASVADWIVLGYRSDGRVWKMFRNGADASFGIFLAHVAVLYVLVQPAVRSVLGLAALPGVPLVVVTFALTVAATWALVEGLRRTPVSRMLTGRARRA